jgi:hypothetical protein
MTKSNDDSTRYCHVSASQVYKCITEEFSAANRFGQWRRAVVYGSFDAGKTWREVPAKLCLRSRLVAGLFTLWPPESVDEMRVERGLLTLIYHDKEYQYERAVLPFGLDRESVWEATLIAHNMRWRLERVRRLDFDGADAHLR